MDNNKHDTDDVVAFLRTIEAEPAYAKPRADLRLVSRTLKTDDGQRWAYFDLDLSSGKGDWDAASRLPRIIEIDGVLYGWSCFDSDRHIAVYSTGRAQLVATPRSGKVGKGRK